MVLEELDGNVGVGVGGDARAGVGKTRIIIDGDGAEGATSRADVSARRGTVFGATVVRATRETLRPITGSRRNRGGRAVIARDVYASELVVRAETSPAARDAAARARARRRDQTRDGSGEVTGERGERDVRSEKRQDVRVGAIRSGG